LPYVKFVRTTWFATWLFESVNLSIKVFKRNFVRIKVSNNDITATKYADVLL